MNWFHRVVIANPERAKQSTQEIASAYRPRNDAEVTDPGIDIYIPPPASQPFSWPTRWLQSLMSRKKVREEAAEIIAKIERLPQATDAASRYFFDHDLPRLIHLNVQQPLVVQEMLRNCGAKGPWLRLVQIACGDAQAILPALEELC